MSRIPEDHEKYIKVYQTWSRSILQTHRKLQRRFWTLCKSTLTPLLHPCLDLSAKVVYERKKIFQYVRRMGQGHQQPYKGILQFVRNIFSFWLILWTLDCWFPSLLHLINSYEIWSDDLFFWISKFHFYFYFFFTCFIFKILRVFVYPLRW